MKLTRVVKIGKAPYDEYIGRPKQPNMMHWGNPFGLSGDKCAVRVSSRTEAMNRFWYWLEGTADQNVEPERRQWILDNLESLRGKRLGCFCMPQPCHGLIYRAFLGEITKEQALSTQPWQEVQNDIFAGAVAPTTEVKVVVASEVDVEDPPLKTATRARVMEEDQLDLFG
ncbi:DUF4326 domain-containing protein [Pseudomonas serbica]|uniref:DUF4326 domain-containing protein n=1 Tax=Pseudomonas serbica TaxID=2965074 RepID=UPI00237B6E89|nr:DUF4326 domain-containing protein [Pseudomonas serbica]